MRFSSTFLFFLFLDFIITHKNQICLHFYANDCVIILAKQNLICYNKIRKIKDEVFEMSNVLIMHGGAPTAVINSSLAGVLAELKKQNFSGKILAARFGSSGLMKEDFIDLTNVTEDKIQGLKSTPGSAIGTSRFPLEKEDYERIIEILKKNHIKYVFLNGGNGTMDTCGNIHNLAKNCGITVVGIPKTIDNDIMETDHAPGYASAARYLACTVKEAIQDIHGLPIHVSVIESMGRNAGWLTAASALARNEEGDAPDLIYCPECAFDEDKFLGDIESLFTKKGGVTVVASEGLCDKDKKPIVEPIFKVGRATYFGDVSSHLANLIIKKLGIKARSEKPGLIQRASSTFASKVDVEEAFVCGSEAVKAALAGVGGVMIGLERVSTMPYQVKTTLIDINKVMLVERMFPEEFLTAEKNNVTDKFIEWAKPLIGEIPEYVSFLD